MKKILQVIPCLYRGGTEAYVINHCRILSREGFHFDFFVYGNEDYPCAEEIRAMGCNIFFGLVPSVRNTVKFYRAIRKVIRDHGPYDAIHCHANIQNTLPLLCARLSGIQVRVSHAHSVDPAPRQVLPRALFSVRRCLIRCCATHWLACSTDAGDSIYGKAFFHSRGRVQKNGIAVEEFINEDFSHTDALRREFRIPEDCPLVVGNISRFDKNKNQTFALSVFGQLLKAYPQAVLLLGGGDAGELEHVRSAAEKLGIEDHVRFIGVRSDVRDCLHLIRVYLFPSISEGLPISLLEAQASGCFCAVSEGIPNSADMGLGSVSFHSLSQSSELWAQDICRDLCTWQEPDTLQISAAFSEKGYNIRSTAELLKQIYAGQVPL